jgi:hypothetical protein
MRAVVDRQEHKTARTSGAHATLNYLWTAFPSESENLRPYIERAKAYRNDCGCTLGGIFVVGTFAALILYGFVFRGFELRHWLIDTVSAAACLLGAALVGKMTGIGLARIRLILLGHELRTRYHGLVS